MSKPENGVLRSTKLPSAPAGHKARRGGAIFVLLLLLGAAEGAAAQAIAPAEGSKVDRLERWNVGGAESLKAGRFQLLVAGPLGPSPLDDPPLPRASFQPSGRPSSFASFSPSLLSSVVSAAGAGVVALLPGWLDINEPPTGCAPCDRRNVPFFDRWATGEERAGVSVTSTVLLLGLAGGTWLDQMGADAGTRFGRIAASAEAAAWAVAVTQVLKAVAARPRPVLYGDGALDAAADVDSRRSLPSGHAAAAMALATSYWLHQQRQSATRRWLALAAAGSVGVLRVAAGRHFPSDVVAGLAVGAGTAVLVEVVRF